MGYKKVDFSVFKSIRKRANVNHDATVFQFDNTWYVALALEQKPLEFEDIVCSDSNPFENEYGKRPDEMYENLTIPRKPKDKNGKLLPYDSRKILNWEYQMESEKDPENSDKPISYYNMTKQEKESSQFKKIFNNKSALRKKVTLRNFIAKNKNNPQYKEEVSTAKKLLRGLGA